MTKEFVLSDYAYEDVGIPIIETEKVKEFIKFLKEGMLKIRYDNQVLPMNKKAKERASLFNKLIDRIVFEFATEIDKLAGKSLI